MRDQLDRAHQVLGWPKPDLILTPPGKGASISADLAKRKIGNTIRRLPGGDDVRVGVLVGNPKAEFTERPIAVVCEFHHNVPRETLLETHRLAWNFCKAPLLISLEPNIARVWSAYEAPLATANPTIFESDADRQREIVTLPFSENDHDRAFDILNWLNLLHGQHIKEFPEHFDRSQCADTTLLENLKFVRRKLHGLGLSYDIIHDIIARVIFIQFLEDRKDSDGYSALNPRRYESLESQGVLGDTYSSFKEVLRSFDDTYSLFKWLNTKFNGDLFPNAKPKAVWTPATWEEEISEVSQRHLDLLADFVAGDLEMSSGQLRLWPYYSFDAIPLSFISSIYEQFVNDRPGTHYTPGHLVDYVLDKVLPWGSEKWDLKILDPSCGSGIFLVKAYQRLIQRWKNANVGKAPKAKILRKLLKNSIYGIDIDEHAVRVASFSLYLAMCDEIDPRYYWQQVSFPHLRGSNLIASDFFSEEVSEGDHQGNFDLIVGNVPWGRSTMSEQATTWQKDIETEWESAYKNIGPLFLPRAAEMASREGKISLLQPALNFLHNQSRKAKEFRDKFFSTYTVEEITNFSACRHDIFSNSTSPSCLVTYNLRSEPSDFISYVCPKMAEDSEDEFGIEINQHDVHRITRHEATKKPLVWTALMWGSRRDLSLLERLNIENPNLAQLKNKVGVSSREGIIRGDEKKVHDNIVGRPLLDGSFPAETLLEVDPEKLPVNIDPRAHSRDSTQFDAFLPPQLLIKQSWTRDDRRFKAAVNSGAAKKGVICTQSYLSVHAPDEYRKDLRSSALVLNSKLAVYYLMLTSARMATYRPEPLTKEWLRVPYPKPESISTSAIQNLNDIDRAVEDAFDLKPYEKTLIDDLFTYTLPSFKGIKNNPADEDTIREGDGRSEPTLTDYCSQFIEVLKAGFGHDKNIDYTIYTSSESLPVRMVCLHLDVNQETAISRKRHIKPNSSKILRDIYENVLTGSQISGFDQTRVVRLYLKDEHYDAPSVYLVKPDKRKFWTQSSAMRDADQVASDILSSFS